VAGIESNRMRSRCSLSSREWELAALVTVVVAGTSMRTYLMATSHYDREDQALVIEESSVECARHRSATGSRAKAHTDFNAPQVEQHR
jgi:hypothetical protein